MKQLSILLVALLLLNCGTKPKKESDNSVMSESAQTEKPNVLLIIVDDQGYADFTAFAKHDNTVESPNIERLGKVGTVFSQAYVTAPVCSPSRAGLITGKNQFRWDKPASWGPGLPNEVKTLAEYLKDGGYATAKIGKNDLGRNFYKNNVREYPLNHGFEHFIGFNAHAHDYWLTSQEIKDRTPDPENTSALLGPLMNDMGAKSYPDDEYLTDILTNEAVDYLGKKSEKPFFLTLSYNAVHHLIHEVPQKYLDKYGVKAIPNYDPDNEEAFEKQATGSYSAYYDKYSRMGAIGDEDMRKYYLANLNCLDDNIGRILDALDKNGLDKNTMVIFISDNGGSPLTGSNNAPLTGGKYALWEGGIRVPLAIRWPGNIKAGKDVDAYVSATDILPTVMNAAGLKTNDPTLDGISLLKPDPNRLLVWKWQKTWAVRRGDFKLTNTDENHWKSRPSAQYIKPILDDKSLKLFNVNTDPGERKNLAEANPEKVAELKAAYEQWCAENIGKY